MFLRSVCRGRSNIILFQGDIRHRGSGTCHTRPSGRPLLILPITSRQQRHNSLSALRGIRSAKECPRTRICISRLIWMNQGLNGELKPQLHATSESDQHVRYRALSHCWGGMSDLPFLKPSGVDELMAGIGFASLAESFQNAATMAHVLDF